MPKRWNSIEKLIHRIDNPPQFCGYVLAAAAVVSLGYGVYKGSTYKSPNTEPTPDPSNSVQYDDNGDIVATQTYDKATNTWITKGKQDNPNATPEETAVAKEEKRVAAEEKQKLSDLRTKMLDNLNTTPEDRVQAYAEYQQAYADAAHKDIDPRFAKIERTAEEQANATGMFGSRAYVDTKSELAKDKLSADTDIANQAVLAKEQLANNDRNYYADMLNQIDNGARADTLTQSQKSQSIANTANQQYAGITGQVNAQNANNIAEWQTRQQRNASYINSGTNLAGGLMYLYGNKTGLTGANTSLTGTNTSLTGAGSWGTGNTIYN